MRGARAALPARKAKADVLLVAARYAEDGRLMIAQGYVRHDQVWTDVNLFDRKSLIERLRSGQHLATAVPRDLASDFSLQSRVTLKEADGQARLLIKGSSASHDDLGLPLF